MPAPNLDELGLYDFTRTIRDSLCLDETIGINPDLPIANIQNSDGTVPDSLDILDIFRRLGINYLKYCSGERLNEKGRDLVAYTLEQAGCDKELIRRFRERKFINIQECLAQLTPRMLAYAAEYDMCENDYSQETA